MNGGIFGNLFDFNGDGELDSFEHTVDFLAFKDLFSSDDDEGDDEDDSDI